MKVGTDLSIEERFEKALYLYEENNKILHLLKRKNVNIGLLKVVIKSCKNFALEEYNKQEWESPLTEKEYDLLKEWLEK